MTTMAEETQGRSAVQGPLAPEYLPGLSLCRAMCKEGTILIADRLQYSRQSLQNRARLRTPDGSQWITIPITGGQFGVPIAETKIDNGVSWASRHMKSLRFNYASAPYYDYYIDDIQTILGRNAKYLGEITVRTVLWAHRVLGCSSKLVLEDPLEVVVEAQAETGTDAHLGIGAVSQDDATIVVQPYRQNFPGFESGLSVLDLLMNHGPASMDILRRHPRES